MSKEEVLQRIKKDIESGDLGKAKERLKTLVYKFPNDFELREMLAEIYYKTHQYAQAGRFWYLSENKTERMKKACKEFEKFCQYSPWVIRDLICFMTSKHKTMDIEKLPTDESVRIINDLQKRIKKSIWKPSKSKRNKINVFPWWLIQVVIFVLFSCGLLYVIVKSLI